MPTVITNLVDGEHRIWMPYGMTRCGEDPNDPEEAYTLDQIGYIVLCPQSLPPTQDAVVGNRNTDYTQVQYSYIDDIGTALSVTILHEFMHMYFAQS
jgi:hypothetical protein